MEKFHKIFEDFSARPEDCVMITDTVGDVLEAEAAGVNSIVILWGYQKQVHFENLKKDIALVGSPEELPAAVEKFFT